MRRSRSSQVDRGRSHGASLLEFIAVIVIIAVLGSFASVALTRQAEAYSEATKRAELSDMVSGALSRMARDIRRAVPNTCRAQTVGGITYLEIVLARGGGIYRTGTGGDTLDTSASDTSFNAIGRFWAADDIPQAAEQPQAGDFVVIENTSLVGTANNVYGRNAPGCSGTGAGCNSQVIQSITGPTNNEPLVTLAAGRQFPINTANRFFIAHPNPVTFRCEPGAVTNGNASGTLRRITGYTIDAAQPTPGIGANDGLLAENVSDCALACDGGGATRDQMVWMRLGVVRGNQSVSLYHATQVNNSQ